MKYVALGKSDLKVSEVCLGTMTWGVQNTEAEAHEQIEYALSQGVNFMDTAEMYAIPPTAETYGKTEQYIGSWLAKNTGQRENIVIASKIVGNGVPWIRGGSDITADSIKQAIDGSLQRLQTDYIDLYQLHWPNRLHPHFSRHWPGHVDFHETDSQQSSENFLSALEALDESIKAGKIRHCGLSNETPWAISEYQKLSETHNLPCMVSVQNEFSLLHLKDSPYVMESCALTNTAYLPWSPLAGGALSGKYRHGAKPENCRWTMVQRNGLFRNTTQTHRSIEAYYEVAKRHNLSLAELSLAWVYQFPGVTSTIIGATSMEQLKEDIDAYSLSLDEQVLSEIDAVIHQFPVPF